jgi:putative peptidoglycan lipid II flippase
LDPLTPPDIKTEKVIKTEKDHKSLSVVKSSLVYSGFTLISRFMGLARDLVIGATLGASNNIMADAYYTAQSFPNLFRRIFAEGAFTAAFVPAYASVLESDGAEAADKLARDALATITAITLALTLAAQIAMPWLMSIFSHGYLDDPVKFKLAVTLTQITMPYLPCMTLVALLSGVLNARGRFILSAAAPTVLNLVMLVCVWPQPDPLSAAYAASWAVLIAGIAQGALLIWGVRKAKARIGFVWPGLSAPVRNLLWLAVPGAFAAAATQINVFVSQALSSSVDGARSWMNYADRLYQLPLGLVGVAVGVALLPALSRSVQAGDHEKSQKAMDEAVVFSMALTLPCAAALMGMPFFLIDGLFTRGEFKTYDAVMTGQLLFHYGWGVIAFVLSRVLTPAFFARKDTLGPMRFALISVVLNVALCFVLFPTLGVSGLVIATSASAWVNVILMLVSLARRKVWAISPKSLASLIKLLICGAGMGVFCALSSTYRAPLEALVPLSHLVKEVAILAVCFMGILVYSALLLITGAVTLADLKRLMKRS